MTFRDMLETMIARNASDIFIRVGSQLRGRIHTVVEILDETIFDAEGVERIVQEITTEKDKANLNANHGCEFAFWYKDCWRFRAGIFYQRNTPAIVIRKVDLRIPTFKELNLPESIMDMFSRERRGLILFTGITGSGKSTAIASLIENINQNSGRHILTVEEPIEFTFVDKKSLINQREIGIDVASYEEALRQFAVHSPDVIYIGNIRDERTCHAALTAAETGVLVLSTMHTVNASLTVERLINFFPPHQHQLILNQLSFLLKGVMSLRLIPKLDGSGLTPAYETMLLSPSVSRLIRENKVWELPAYISKGDVYGMKSFHQCLMELVQKKLISPKLALEYSDKKEEMEMELRNKGLM